MILLRQQTRHRRLQLQSFFCQYAVDVGLMMLDARSVSSYRVHLIDINYEVLMWDRVTDLRKFIWHDDYRNHAPAKSRAFLPPGNPDSWCMNELKYRWLYIWAFTLYYSIHGRSIYTFFCSRVNYCLLLFSSNIIFRPMHHPLHTLPKSGLIIQMSGIHMEASVMIINKNKYKVSYNIRSAKCIAIKK